MGGFLWIGIAASICIPQRQAIEILGVAEAILRAVKLRNDCAEGVTASVPL